jgi:UMF1 family MFS transporter
VAITALFVLIAFLFDMSFGFYNGFLPELADEQSMDRVSAWGFALGYLGGGIALILALVIISLGPRLGLPTIDVQLRASLALMGLWWGVFTLPAVLVLRDRRPPRMGAAGLINAARRSFSEVKSTLTHVRLYRSLALFLVGFLFYNDAVQTVLTQSSTFATTELKFETNELVMLVLMIQFVAFPGALLVAWISQQAGQRAALFGCLAIWTALLVSGYFVQTKLHFWIMGAAIAFVMGGIQSVSRAMMGVMTPPQHQAEFFGFFNFSGKAFSFLGPAVFGLVVALTGSARLAIVSLTIQLVVGWIIVSRVNIAQGRREALAASADSPGRARS